MGIALGVAAVLAGPGLRWARDAVVWPCTRNGTGACTPGTYDLYEGWYHVQRAAYNATPPGTRFLTLPPFELAGFEQFSERESVVAWYYPGASVYNRARLADELDRLRRMGVDLSAERPMILRERVRQRVAELAHYNADQWRDLGRRLGVRYVVA